VLPFANIAGDSTINLVADGLADEVASSLARVPGILIKSRTGARRYRGQLAPDVTEAGARLKADYLLTAVIRQERGRWMLSADFEHAADASSLWDARFDVSPNEQTAIADSIAASLTAELRRQFPRAIGVAPPRSTHQQTSNSEAYRLYVKGEEKLARRGQSVSEAAELFRQAIREDSLFAPAHSGLSMALALFPWFHKVPAPQMREAIVTTARRALALDSSQSQPHVALGVAHWQAYHWDSAATEFQTAIRLNPRDVEARVQYARLLRDSGRFTDGLTQLRVARDLDPASALVLSQMSTTYSMNGQLDSAVVEGRRALETDSTNYTALLSATWAFYSSGRTQQARALVVQLPGNYEGRGYLMAKLGDVDGARQLLRGLDARPATWGYETHRALTYLGLGDTAQGLSALERATDAGEIWPTNVPVPQEPYDAVRKSARFRVLLERVGLAGYIPALTR
jgi:TolB-like protein